MMRCNLAIMMAERNLKITKISNDTGISRTTLTSIYYNYAKGIQFDTYNTLCLYLKTTPDKLITYIPVDIDLGYFSKDAINVTIRTNNTKCSGQLSLYTDLEIEHVKSEKYAEEYINIKSLDIYVGLFEPHNEEEKETNSIILSAFQSLTLPFLSDLESSIISELCTNYDVPDDSEITFTWEDDLDHISY